MAAVGPERTHLDLDEGVKELILVDVEN